MKTETYKRLSAKGRRRADVLVYIEMLMLCVGGGVAASAVGLLCKVLGA